MKFRKFLSELLFGLGCALAFIGLLTIVLPTIQNPQLQLVLSSFSMTSSNAAVSLINRFMTFALQQNWRVLYLGLLMAGTGAWLLMRFMPAPKKNQPIEAPAAVTAPAQSGPEKPNPFAKASVIDIPSAPEYSSKAASILHSEPILECNRIKEDEPGDFDAAPYFSPRFSAESRAIETEVGLPSQSGSRILVRSAYEPMSSECPATEPTPVVEPETAEGPSPVLAVPAAITPPSPRIRSTMGRHTPGSSNLPLSRS